MSGTPASARARSAAFAHSGATAYRIAPSTWTSAAALVLGFDGDTNHPRQDVT